MDGIVTILEEKYYQAVQAIWQDLQHKCGVKGVSDALLVPHFSWHVAMAYPDEVRLDKVLEQASLHIKPFTVSTSGVGIFFHPKPVVYLPLVKTRALIEVHQMLWDQLAGLSDQASLYYAPDAWMPHITLVYEELSGTALDCVLLHLSGLSLDWKLQVDNLALIGQASDTFRPVCIQHMLRGENDPLA